MIFHLVKDFIHSFRLGQTDMVEIKQTIVRSQKVKLYL